MNSFLNFYFTTKHYTESVVSSAVSVVAAMFCLSLPLLPYFVDERSEGSGETAHFCMLV